MTVNATASGIGGTTCAATNPAIVNVAATDSKPPRVYSALRARGFVIYLSRSTLLKFGAMFIFMFIFVPYDIGVLTRLYGQVAAAAQLCLPNRILLIVRDVADLGAAQVRATASVER